MQHWATKLVFGLEKLTYEEHLDKLGLTTFQYKGLRGDMIELFKILDGLLGVILSCIVVCLDMCSNYLWIVLVQMQPTGNI